MGVLRDRYDNLVDDEIGESFSSLEMCIDDLQDTKDRLTDYSDDLRWAIENSDADEMERIASDAESDANDLRYAHSDVESAVADVRRDLDDLKKLENRLKIAPAKRIHVKFERQLNRILKKNHIFV